MTAVKGNHRMRVRSTKRTREALAATTRAAGENVLAQRPGGETDLGDAERRSQQEEGDAVGSESQPCSSCQSYSPRSHGHGVLCAKASQEGSHRSLLHPTPRHADPLSKLCWGKHRMVAGSSGDCAARGTPHWREDARTRTKGPTHRAQRRYMLSSVVVARWALGREKSKSSRKCSAARA